MPNCVNCGAPMQTGDNGVPVCSHCGSVDERGGVAYDLQILGASAVACPQCAATLDDARIEGCPVRYCSSCRGVLVEMKYFMMLGEAVRAREPRQGVGLPRRQQPGERALSCPSCGQPMLSHLYGGPGNIVLDTCERCSVNWLDPDELRRIARAP